MSSPFIYSLAFSKSFSPLVIPCCLFLSAYSVFCVRLGGEKPNRWRRVNSILYTNIYDKVGSFHFVVFLAPVPHLHDCIGEQAATKRREKKKATSSNLIISLQGMSLTGETEENPLSHKMHSRKSYKRGPCSLTHLTLTSSPRRVGLFPKLLHNYVYFALKKTTISCYANTVRDLQGWGGGTVRREENSRCTGRISVQVVVYFGSPYWSFPDCPLRITLLHGMMGKNYPLRSHLMVSLKLYIIPCVTGTTSFFSWIFAKILLHFCIS